MTLGLRPEEIRVRDVKPSDRTSSRLVGSSNFSALSAARSSSPRARPRALVADFSANLMRDLDVAEGQRLLIALPPEALRVFAAAAQG